MSLVNQQWRLAAHPQGLIQPTDFRWHEEPVRDLCDGEVLIRVEMLSPTRPTASGPTGRRATCRR
jgi:NADPH-dependent curcumin reductase CurA